MSKIKSEGITTGAGRRRSARQLRRFSPIFGVRDLRAAMAHYATLGFETFAYDDGDAYGFARRDGVELHLAAGPEHDRPGSGAAYLYVRDADALYEQWSRPGVAGHTHPVGPTPYRLREGSHVDRMVTSSVSVRPWRVTSNKPATTLSGVISRAGEPVAVGTQ